MDKEQTYKAFVYCKNCSFRKEIEIEKGVSVEGKECPNCGCIGLIKDANAERKGRKTDSYYNFR